MRKPKVRRFVDAPSAERCTASVKLRDGTTAQCGRRAIHTGKMLCTQHYKIAARSETATDAGRRAYFFPPAI